MNKNHLIANYLRCEKLGEGTYGVVYKAKNKDTGKISAIKRIKTELNEGLHCSTLREIAFLKHFNHPNIVTLEEVIFSLNKIYIVFEFMDMDLQMFLLKYDSSIDEKKIQCILYQILQGLLYCHTRRVIHRDLKPQNILTNKEGTMIKLADFGLSRIYGIPSMKMTTEIITQWYRAPEIILGAKTYNCAVDMWSLGCIFGEMALGGPLFNGDSEIGQLFKIFQVNGTPRFSCVFKKLEKWQEVFPIWEGVTLAVKLKGYMSPIGIDLISKILTYNPLERLSSQEALLHDYFLNFDKSCVPASNGERETYEKNYVPQVVELRKPLVAN